MTTNLVQRVLWTAVVAASLVSCGTRSRAVNGSQALIADLPAISVAIIHGNVTDGTAGRNWNIEDDVEFRKGPSQRFSVHIT